MLGNDINKYIYIMGERSTTNHSDRILICSAIVADAAHAHPNGNDGQSGWSKCCNSGRNSPTKASNAVIRRLITPLQGQSCIVSSIRLIYIHMQAVLSSPLKMNDSRDLLPPEHPALLHHDVYQVAQPWQLPDGDPCRRSPYVQGVLVAQSVRR